jgi:hypothetical protein
MLKSVNGFNTNNLIASFIYVISCIPMYKPFLLAFLLLSTNLFAQQIENKGVAAKRSVPSKSDSLLNILQMNAMMLNEVKIKGTKDYKVDSINRRAEYASIFNYKAPTIVDVFIKKSPEKPSQYSAFQSSTSSIASISVLPLIGLLTKNKSSISKLQKNLLKEEEARLLDNRFSKEKVTAITSLKGDSLENFMEAYRPGVERTLEMNDYEMLLYIKKSYGVYIKPSSNASEP